MTTYQNRAFANQNIVVDGNRYVACSFRNVGLVYTGGDLPSFEGCTFQSISLQLGGAALSTVRYLSGLHQGGIVAPVEAALKRIEAGPPSPEAARRYNPEYVGTNWGTLGFASLILIGVTVVLLLALHYGLQVFPRTQILNGDPPRPLAAQIPLELMPALPDELAVVYDELRESQLGLVTTYGWIDEAQGVVHIPVDAAMDQMLRNNAFPVAGE
jgi:hypothetical protein